MATIRWKPTAHDPHRENPGLLHRPLSRISKPFRSICFPRSAAFPCNPISFRASDSFTVLPIVRAGVTETPSVADDKIIFSETFPVRRIQTVEGKITVRLDRGEEEGSGRRLTVGCSLEANWILHWGVTYCDELGSEWDQPPPEMRPPGSITIKDYAIETPLVKSSSPEQGQMLYELQIDLGCSTTISAIHFVLKEERTGAWFQHKGTDFRVPLMGDLEEDKERNYLEGKENLGGGKQKFSIWTGPHSKENDTGLKPKGAVQQSWCSQELYEEYPISKEEMVENTITVTARRSDKTDKNHICFETDIPGDVVMHWGVCKDNSKKWEIPPTPHPPATKVFRQKALRTLLQRKENDIGCWASFLLDKDVAGLLFVLKLNEYVWVNNMGTDFYIPLTSEEERGLSANQTENVSSNLIDSSKDTKEYVSSDHTATTAYTDEIINDIRNLATDISSGKSKRTKSKEMQENILQEIEKLAAEAYSIFRSSTPTFKESITDTETSQPGIKVCSGTGSGFEVLCQGFNWESHKSGRWYSELSAKASELSSLGFTILWLPPPTESVSPEGYMPTDLYNLNSRYGNMDELKDLARRFHEVGIRVLGDVVLNHRCAHYQNNNGVWNIFGGRLNWDDRAIVADDPHFQGKGNKSSGDNFHAAPNIDHSQEFVRKDLKEWLCWLRKEVGYDGWRLDFVRGFWGGYVTDYLEATEPYFAVGEYWDSLSYTYGEMDYNQDAHRQRIIDWINATNGTAGAFDVTTKGILHTALEKCEYWRLSDEKGKPPGVVGWWPSRAVTFIENHDTGSTQGHWRFPSGKEMQGYAYILTHPGTPAVFFDHIFSHYQQEICRLISLRHHLKIHCRSLVTITKAERDVYAAVIDEKLAVKIGPGHYELPTGPKQWKVVAEGREYKVWEAS